MKSKIMVLAVVMAVLGVGFMGREAYPAAFFEIDEPVEFLGTYDTSGVMTSSDVNIPLGGMPLHWLPFATPEIDVGTFGDLSIVSILAGSVIEVHFYTTGTTGMPGYGGVGSSTVGWWHWDQVASPFGFVTDVKKSYTYIGSEGDGIWSGYGNLVLQFNTTVLFSDQLLLGNVVSDDVNLTFPFVFSPIWYPDGAGIIGDIGAYSVTSSFGITFTSGAAGEVPEIPGQMLPLVYLALGGGLWGLRKRFLVKK